MRGSEGTGRLATELSVLLPSFPPSPAGEGGYAAAQGGQDAGLCGPDRIRDAGVVDLADDLAGLISELATRRQRLAVAVDGPGAAGRATIAVAFV
jgi:hypothetical protein